MAIAMAFAFAGQTSTAQAQGPSDSGTAGITVDPSGPRTPAQLGYTQSYADTKVAHFTNALKVRMTRFASTSGVAPELVGPPAPMTATGRVPSAAPISYLVQLDVWLVLTLLFANFASAIAEARGKAQADALRKTRQGRG